MWSVVLLMAQRGADFRLGGFPLRWPLSSYQSSPPFAFDFGFSSETGWVPHNHSASSLPFPMTLQHSSSVPSPHLVRRKPRWRMFGYNRRTKQWANPAAYPPHCHPPTHPPPVKTPRSCLLTTLTCPPTISTRISNLIPLHV